MPNVSLVEDINEVFYNPFIKNAYLKLKYNVTSTSEATPLIAEERLNDLEEIIIDGDSISLVKEYTFATIGEHEVWFRFTDEAINYNGSGSAYVAGFILNTNIIEIIEIPTDLYYITKSAFSGCGIIKANLYTPNSKLNTIDYDSFAGNVYLNELILPNILKTINSAAFGTCTGLTELIIPNSVEIISSGAFSGCHGIERLKLSSSMKVIVAGNWGGNRNLREVIIPEGVETINSGAFVGCTGLKNIVFPASIKELQAYSFSGSGLNNITFLSKSSPTIPADAFAEVAQNGTLYVPYGCTEAYSYLLSMEDGYLGAQGWTIQELPQE